MTRFRTIDTPISNLKLIERKRMSDDRGYLARLFCMDELVEAGWRKPIAQINHTMTIWEGAVRGFHFQLPPYAEMKLVTCVRGEIWDVAVDLRRDSPSFLQWFGAILSSSNDLALLIPEGFAHGFQAMTDDCELIYLHTSVYHAASERGIHVEDPRLAVRWPKPISELSSRDRSHPFLSSSFQGIFP